MDPMKGRLSLSLVGLAAAAVVLLGARGPSAQAQPMASITLPAPGTPKQLYAGCNNIGLTFPEGTSSQEVVQAVTPAGAVEAMWRHNAALNKFEGFSPAFPQASDLMRVDFLEAVWLCMVEDLSAIGPPPVVIIPPAPICAGPPAVASFTATPNTITAGQSSTLSWGPVENTDHVVIDQGIGEVAGWNSMVVTPATTTTYTLTATGCGGTTTYQVTVTVNAAPPAQFTADVEITDLVLQGSGANTLVLAVLRNNGPDNMVNVQLTLQCEASLCPNNVVPCWGNIIHTYQAQSILLSLAPGQTTQVSSLHFFNSNTDYTDYAKCTATVPWADPNPANNTRTETPVQ
jgi:hypothetical protein